MKRRRLLEAALLAAAGGAVLAGAAMADERPKSTVAERAQAVRFARELEAEPTSADAVSKRKWLVAWYTRIPDITITVCTLLAPFPKEDHPFFPEVLAQGIFSGGAFIIEHPDRATDQVAVQTAGMAGSLRVYEAFAKAQPEHRLPHLDDLLAKSKAGTLEAHMREAVPKGCSKSKE